MCQHHAVTIPNDLFFDQLLSFLKEQKEVAFTLKGDSMVPFLRNGDKIILGNFDAKSLKTGHIVLVQSDGRYILHRIIRITAEKIWLAGDANIVQTERIDRQDILALALEAYRNDQKVSIYGMTTLIAARFWYYMRPFRRVVAVLSRSFGRKNKK